MPNLSIASHVSRYLHPDFLRQRLSALSEDDRTLIQEYLTTLALRNYSPDTIYCHITTWVTFLRAVPHAALRTLTVRDIERTIAFYERALGMRAVTFGESRRALAFGDQKLNLHQAGREFEPKAKVATPGAIDLCFRTDVPLDEVVAHLRREGVAIELGPVAKVGARAALRSIYVRDPDGNLIEVANETRP